MFRFFCLNINVGVPCPQQVPPPKQRVKLIMNQYDTETIHLNLFPKHWDLKNTEM